MCFSPRVSLGQSPSSLIHSLPHLTLFTFLFSLYYSLHLFSCFSIPSHSTRVVPLSFQAGCCRRRLNLALVFLCWFYVIYIFLLRMHACFCSILFSFVLCCDSCFPCTCYHNNLNEPLDPFPLFGGCWTKRHSLLLRLIYYWLSITG